MVIKGHEVAFFEDGFQASDKYFKLQEIFSIYESKEQYEWNEFFSSSKSYFIKPAILVKKASEVEFEIQNIEGNEKTEEDETDRKKELENMIL